MRLAGRYLLPLLALSVSFLAACEDRDPAGLEVARATIDPLVFDDAYSPDVYFQPFFETHYTAVEIDSVHAFNGFAPDGARSLRIHVPPLGSALGPYSGGVMTSSGKRDLMDFNALTLYARSDVDISLNTIGFGNDNTGTSRYEAGRSGIPLTQEWVFITVPIPAPSKLIAERGLLTFAEGNEEQPPGSGIFPYPNGYHIWIDEIRFAKLGNLEVFRPQMRSVDRTYFIGSTVGIEGVSTVFLQDGGFVVVDHSSFYYDYFSSDETVAVEDDGQVLVIGEGTAEITAKLEDRDVFGSIRVTGVVPPTEAPPTPTLPASDVISMFSNAYVDVPIDTWRADWAFTTTVLEDVVIDGSDMKQYSALNFVGIVFESSPIDASQMTHLHLDVYAPAGTNFKVKVVGLPGGGPDGAETQDLIFDATTTPAFRPGEWSQLEIPLSDFVLPDPWDWSTLINLVLSTDDAQLVLVDNVYWHK